MLESFDRCRLLWRSPLQNGALRMAKLTKTDKAKLARQTRLIVDGRDNATSEGFVNIPPFRGSTVCYPNAAAHMTGRAKYTYGRRGNPTMAALEELWASSKARMARSFAHQARMLFPSLCLPCSTQATTC